MTAVALNVSLSDAVANEERDALVRSVRAQRDVHYTAHYLREDADSAYIHPYFLAARMSPITRHNFVYGPTIHARSQIQHLREARADQDITVGAQIVDAYDRKGHWYQVLDGIVTDSDGTIALVRHYSIFRPR